MSHRHLDLYGEHETEVSRGGDEASLHRHYAACPKNPDHGGFIPIRSFSMQHLPQDQQDPDVYNLVQSVADLTVRIDVKMISQNRPQYWPGTTVPYPFYNMSNCQIMRTGTGSVRAIKYIEGQGLDALNRSKNLCLQDYRTLYKTCPCLKCKPSGEKNNTWWEIEVTTATHVVFDENEASHTICRLFFDEQNSPSVILANLRILTNNISNIERDSCSLIYNTCDATMGDKLFRMSENYYRLLKKIEDKNEEKSHFTFIVSHPHGCPKQVSLGDWTDHYKGEECGDYVKSKLTYTTCTCPGSSGAKVYSARFYCLVHSGTLSTGLNYSSTGLYPKADK
ncbi:uncharacterized protein LOC129928425 isoform X1 [Biomphalaria glabrata]|uniref:Uncharacterized protein LOC129928425 isoform X1 n=2 Tax=Biomphalaria glabrata TaxID=6526 RepID=A0A9W3BH25_BIOGL|nr:uncharacterized protein LOC129928425 isoform X1 [Biomphalaria glabrata]